MSIHRWDRRSLIKSAAGGALALATGELRIGRAAEKSEAVAVENQQPGTTDWLLDKTQVDPETRYRCPAIEGFCSHTSIRGGEKLQVFVSTNPASRFTLDIYRMGYYQGKGGRLMKRLGPLDSATMADPDVGADRLRSCRWSPVAEITIPPDWLSGVYVGKLTSQLEGWQSYLIFGSSD